MTSRIFQTIAPLLSNGEEIHLQIRKEGSALRVVVQPKLANEPEKATDEIKQIRASLAIPLKLTMSPDSLDQEFAAMFTRYGEARKVVETNLDLVLETLKEASKSAKTAPKESAPPKPAASKSETPSDDTEEHAPPTLTPMSNPDSL